MFTPIAKVLSDNIDTITRLWVDELRRTERTEIQNHMLTADIVDGMKATLANLAEAINAQQAPDNETLPMRSVGPADSGLQAVTSAARARATKPLAGPLERALQRASSTGKLREQQGYGFHEVVLEYVKLRQIIWDTLSIASAEGEVDVTLDATRYLDRLLDELMLAALESFYSASVRELETRAIHDVATQLYNKDYFQKRLHEEMRRSLRHSEPLTVAIIDMDHLKTINDTYGHPVGDAVIRAVASAIKASSRQTDVPCRYGGDEFVVILTETAKNQAVVFADRLLQAVSNISVVIASGDETVQSEEVPPRSAGEGNLPLVVQVPGVSIGLASFPEDGRNPEMLVAKADSALYRAKRAGRNRVAL